MTNTNPGHHFRIGIFEFELGNFLVSSYNTIEKNFFQNKIHSYISNVVSKGFVEISLGEFLGSRSRMLDLLNHYEQRK